MSRGTAKPAVVQHAAAGVVLRPLDARHLSQTLAWRNREGVRQRFLHSDVISPEAHQGWFERYLTKPDDLMLLAYEPGSAEPFGQVAIYDIDLDRREAEVGRFVVSPDHQGRGLMRSAMLALVDLARAVIGLQALRLEVRDDNTRAIAIYESIGFVQEGSTAGVLRMRLQFPV